MDRNRSLGDSRCRYERGIEETMAVVTDERFKAKQKSHSEIVSV